MVSPLEAKPLCVAIAKTNDYGAEKLDLVWGWPTSTVLSHGVPASSRRHHAALRAWRTVARSALFNR
jgi:hypothetical protein